ncbi:MAG: hypothetical protein JSS82_07980 [Bacteroidetes bacterium]|nr:hypothetical protein [Bacteroidota bacterium]
MSHAFVKEDDEQWLHDVAPTLNALINYLSRENNGIRVYEKESHANTEGKTIHKMSNGFSYVIDKDGKWSIVD